MMKNGTNYIHLLRVESWNVLCYNGNAHALRTSEKSKVTCPECLKRMKAKGEPCLKCLERMKEKKAEHKYEN
jgi:tRNA(Ile2) C34 agmatinyltransferase TiaS